MSRRHRRNARARHFDHSAPTRDADGDDIPLMIERSEVARAQSPEGLTYEEAKWAYLSPRFREAHNRYRMARGLPAIPPPVIDRYKPPPPNKLIETYTPDSPEVKALMREFERQSMIPGSEGFELKQGRG